MRRIGRARHQAHRLRQEIPDDPQKTDFAFAVFHLTSHPLLIPPFSGRAQEFQKTATACKRVKINWLRSSAILSWASICRSLARFTDISSVRRFESQHHDHRRLPAFTPARPPTREQISKPTTP
jgi:hypothetical protein